MARGFFAELQHQARVQAREQARAEREVLRAHKAAVREWEKARKAEERAIDQAARATEAERKRLEKAARAAHIAAMEAEVEKKNVDLEEIYREIDSVLAATLDVDDYVDLNTLRATADHPPFDRSDLEQPVPPPAPFADPPQPVLALPDPPTGLAGILARRSMLTRSQTHMLTTNKQLPFGMRTWSSAQTIGRPLQKNMPE